MDKGHVKIRVTRMGDGWVVDVEGCGQRVFTSTKECEEFVGGMMISKITVAEYTQVELDVNELCYMFDEAQAVKPDVDEY